MTNRILKLVTLLKHIQNSYLSLAFELIFGEAEVVNTL